MVREVGADPVPDGRAARRDRNRAAVLDAVVALFGEDDLDPSPEQVAVRSGVSLRSVYRYFEDREGLLRAAIDRQVGEVLPLLHLHAIGRGPLRRRVDELVEARLRLYEAVAPAARAARRGATTNAVLRDQVELTRRVLREQFERQFAPELDPLTPGRRDAVAAAGDALCQIETLDLYRVHRGFSVAQTRELLAEALLLLLGATDR
ncbi:MAG: TetR/AcrR family transcriptional regulator [Acidimicrobiales bacterium]|nr:TetR/AcrR family transcriptional regulator [Acidimicrobiales bacterium]